MADIDEVCERLHAAGLRVTAPRRDLVGLFAALGRWCTPQELHVEARKAGIRAGLATVYRLIELLVGLGLCKPFVQRDRLVRYVFCGPGHHHHLICEDCGRVTEITECHVQAPVDGFTVREHTVDFFGHCSKCS